MGGEGELTFDGEEIKIWLGEFLQEVGMSKFWLVRGTYTYVLYIYIYKRLCQQVFIYNDEASCTSHTSCAEVAILLLQDLNTLCVTYIYGMYFHLSIQCSWYDTYITSRTCLISPNEGRSISQNSFMKYIYTWNGW